MTILIANIGTSDLAIKIDDYYFPIGFDRGEPNTDYSDLTENEKVAWEPELRQSYIADVLCPELGVPTVKGKFSFRELTHKILEAYQQDEATWHDRIRPGRIWGVVKTSQLPKFRVKTAYFFVTDQPHDSDSIHLFDILEQWFKREIPNLKLEKKVIPQNISAISQDGLLNYFYHFFLTDIISERNEPILISIKGGTPQMQTALKMQALASGFPKQLFIDPQLSIKKVLAGEPSECQLTSYWRYMRSQKYQAVSLLLETRWDFDGAKQILSEWEKVLKYLIKEKVSDEIILSQSDITLEQVIKALELGMNLLNLDYESARVLLNENPQLKTSIGFEHLMTNQGDEQLLNLYTQCRIFWDLDQVANFLARMSSFYEATLHRLINILDGERYLQDDGYLKTNLVRQEMDEQLWRSFVSVESPYNPNLRNLNPAADANIKLEGRFTKRNFIESLLVPHRQITAEQWNPIINSLKKLDFWATQRNQMIHSAAGVSRQRLNDLLKEYRTKRSPAALQACEPGQIRQVMAAICQSELGIVRQEYREKFVGRDADFYLYSDIANWVLNQLKAESRK